VNKPIRARHLLAVAPLVFLLAACGGDSPDGAAPDEAAGPPPGPVQVNFEPIGEFIAEGAVTLRRSGDSITADILADSHLGPGDYPIHIHEGICEEGGRVVVALQTMTGGEGGEGTSVTRFPIAELPLDGTYFVQMHQSDGTPIACADLPPLTNL